MRIPSNPFEADWKFILEKGLRNILMDAFLKGQPIRDIRLNGLSFYYFRSLPPKDMNHLTLNEESYEVVLNTRGNVAVDIGAHIGSYALRLARNFRWVYAFEPNPETNRLLRLNVKRNRVKNIDVLNCAVSDDLGEAILKVPSTFSPGSTINEKHYDFLNFDRTVKVAKTSLDKFFTEGVGKIDFVKIDTEGHELKVLEGMERIVKKHHPVLSVEVHSEPLSRKCSCNVCVWVQQYYDHIEPKYGFGRQVHWLICK